MLLGAADTCGSGCLRARARGSKNRRHFLEARWRIAPVELKELIKSKGAGCVHVGKYGPPVADTWGLGGNPLGGLRVMCTRAACMNEGVREGRGTWQAGTWRSSSRGRHHDLAPELRSDSARSPRDAVPPIV